MRLKIQSAPPLPVLKVWFTVGEECITVADFRSALAREVFAFKSKSASSFVLTLDGFDLLEASPLLHVLRDGDLVVVKARDTSKKTSGVGRKRKRSISPSEKKTRSILPSSSTHSSSLSSASSSSASSSSSSSSSDTDSDSESDSSSSCGSSTTPPTSASIQRVPVPRVLVPQTQTARKSSTRPPNTATRPMVPPGKGKLSTHSRNQRRRIKRIASTLPGPVPDFVSATNATLVPKPEVEAERRAKARQAKIHGPAPDVASALNSAFGGNERAGRLDPGALDASPVSASSSTLHTPLYPPSEAEETLNVQMMSMIPKAKNKNKSRRGGEEIDPRSRKIVFGTPPPPPSPHISQENREEDEEPRIHRPALIPPSALPAHLIPSNVFITCVDVEEGMKKPKKKKRRVEEEESWDEPVFDTTILDYGEEEGSAMVVEETSAKLALDLTKFDFNTTPLITSHAQLTEGCIIGFKGLLMNLKTFTPENGKRYARVLNWTEDVVTIRPIFEGEEEMNDDVSNEDVEWDDIQGQWKLLQ